MNLSVRLRITHSRDCRCGWRSPRRRWGWLATLDVLRHANGAHRGHLLAHAARDVPQPRAMMSTYLPNRAGQQAAHVERLEEQLADLRGQLGAAKAEAEATHRRLDAALAEAARLRALLNTPEVLDFAKAVQLEAAHQRERWGSDHDAGKADADWFWLLGYLAGKALHNPGEVGDGEKRLHRIVTIAAAPANWHAAVLGRTNMRPGIEPPAGEQP